MSIIYEASMRRFMIILVLSFGLTFLFAQENPKLSPALYNLISNYSEENFNDYQQSFGLKKSNSNNILITLFVTKNNSDIRSEVETKNGYLGTDLGNICVVYLPVDQIDGFVESSGISYIDIAPRGAYKLDVSLSQIQADLVHQGIYPLNKPYQGEDIVVGVIDSGIDIAHPDFQNTDGSTRIFYLWDQTASGNTPSEFSYGTEWTSSEINSGLCPQIDGAENYGHGTHVAGIAAGNGQAVEKYYGIAPKSDLIIVKTDFDFGHIVDGIQYIFNRTGTKPAVVNLSLSTHQGPHDNTSSAAKMINQLVGPGKIVVSAASNEGNKNIHIQYQTENVSVKGTKFSTPDNSQNIIGLDIWYPSSGNISFSIGGIDVNDNWITQTSWVNLGQRSANMPFRDGQKTYGLVTIDAREINNPFNHNRHVYIEISNNNQSYDFSKNEITWVLLTKGSGTFDGWIFDNKSAFTDFTGQSYDVQFEAGNSSSTIGIPGTATRVITVGAHTSKTSWKAADENIYSVGGTLGDWAFFSSIGPTRDGRIKPDITAPGFVIASAISKDANILENYATRVLLGDKHWVIQGTSMAAPHVTGAVALLLQKEPSLTPEELLTILKENAKKDDFTGDTPNNTWGFGKLNVFAAMSSLVSSVSQNSGEKKPDSWELSQNYPNPFNPKLNRNLIIQISGEIKIKSNFLKIYNIIGQEIIQLNLDQSPTENYSEFSWSGIDRLGNQVSPGIYFYRVEFSGRMFTKKFLVIN